MVLKSFAQPEQTTGNLAQCQVPSPWRHTERRTGAQQVQPYSTLLSTSQREKPLQLTSTSPTTGAGAQRGGRGPIYLFGGIILEQITLNVPLHIKNIRCACKVHLLGDFHLKQLQLEGPWGYSQANQSTGCWDGSGKCFKSCFWLIFVPSL